jgi:hypothetical protein
MKSELRTDGEDGFARGKSLIEYLDVILKEADRLNKVLEGILDFTRLKPREMKTFNIHSILDRALTLLEESARQQNIILSRQYDPSLPDVVVVQGGEPEPLIHGAVTTPIFQSSTFETGDAKSYHDLRYIRLSNTPNHDVLHRKLAALENAEAALVTGSGMAAISATLTPCWWPGPIFSGSCRRSSGKTCSAARCPL